MTHRDLTTKNKRNKKQMATVSQKFPSIFTPDSKNAEPPRFEVGEMSVSKTHNNSVTNRRKELSDSSRIKRYSFNPANSTIEDCTSLVDARKLRLHRENEV